MRSVAVVALLLALAGCGRQSLAPEVSGLERDVDDSPPRSPHPTITGARLLTPTRLSEPGRYTFHILCGPGPHAKSWFDRAWEFNAGIATHMEFGPYQAVTISRDPANPAEVRLSRYNQASQLEATTTAHVAVDVDGLVIEIPADFAHDNDGYAQWGMSADAMDPATGRWVRELFYGEGFSEWRPGPYPIAVISVH